MTEIVEWCNAKHHASCPINWDAHNRAIRNATLKKLLEDTCKQCPLHEEFMPLEVHCAESCDQCLVQLVVNQSLRTQQEHP